MAQDVEFLRAAARAVEAKLPDNHGFILLVAPYGDGGRLRYIASIERPCAIAMLKEFLIRAGAEEDWMKQIN